MIITKSGTTLLIELEEEENEVIEYLTETRGSTYILKQLEFWLKGRTDTVREELRIELVKDTFPIGIKELRELVKDKSEIEEESQKDN